MRLAMAISIISVVFAASPAAADEAQVMSAIPLRADRPITRELDE